MKLYNCESRVLSLDIDLSKLAPLAKEPRPDITFIEGDVFEVEKHFPEEFLKVSCYLTIIRRRRSQYCRIIPETKSRGLFDNIH